MSYSINFNVSKMFNDDGMERYLNVSWDYLSSDDDFIVTTEQFKYWYKDNYILEDDTKVIDIEDEIIDRFIDSEAYYELQDSYYPIYNYIHLLQNTPNEDDIKKINDNAPNIVIIYIEDLDSHFIALTGCGMDMSDSISYAYMVIDMEVPKSVIPRQKLTLRDGAYKELMEFLNVL